MSPVALSKIRNDMEQIITGAPDSAFSIPESPRGNPYAINKSDGTSSNPHEYSGDVTAQPGAVVRSMGCSRRVFLINPSLTPTEIDGLSYRIRSMASNGGINSILMGNPLEDAECNGDMSENITCLPSYIDDDAPEKQFKTSNDNVGPYGNRSNYIKSILHERFGDGLGMPYVSTGYDAKSIYEMGMHNDPQRLEHELMNPLISLSKAVRGSYDETINSSPSKVPCISLPNGLVTDAGYSLLLGSYVLATHSTAFKILNPMRGLAFDPVGLSYLLPRIGWEFKQASAPYSMACASLLALCGYEANAEDMVATGLATHYIGGPFKLNLLERTLSDLNSYEYQALFPQPQTLYGDNEPKKDVNDPFRNIAVANLIQHLSEYDAAEANEYGAHLKEDLDDETGLFLKDKDPSITMHEERIQMYGELVSELVCWAATFNDALTERTVEGKMERLREIAATKAEFEGREDKEEDVLVAEQAQSLVNKMEQRSPLALCAMNELMLMGLQEDETLESCMEREKASQMRLFSKQNGDYARWAESGKGVGLVEMNHGNSSMVKDIEDSFSDWKHSSIKEVNHDEVKEILGI